MPMCRYVRILILIGGLVTADLVAADESTGWLEDYLDRLAADDGGEYGTISLHLGGFDAFDQSLSTKAAAFEAGLEYRFPGLGWGLAPIVGLSGTADWSVYGYAGLRWEVPVWQTAAERGLYLDLSFAVAAYEEGDGKDLGGLLEFRSGLGLAYRFTESVSVGIGAYHLSHAGLYGGSNPGANSFLVNFAFTP